MVISRVLSCRSQATFLFPLGTLPILCRRHSPCAFPMGNGRPLLVRFRVRRNYSNRCPPYVLKILRRSDLGGPRNFSKSPSPIFPFKCSISGKTVCQNLVHMTRGVPENSSSLISRRPFRIH